MKSWYKSCLIFPIEAPVFTILCVSLQNKEFKQISIGAAIILMFAMLEIGESISVLRVK